MRASAFYSMMRNPQDEVHAIAVDLQAVHSLPKVAVGESYYSRQLSLYNFGLCDLTLFKNYSYTWLESQSGRGSNEICSAVVHYLDLLKNNVSNRSTDKTILQLFMDGCGGQNKNNIVVSGIATWLKSQDDYEEYHLIYPVRGHTCSFLPCDRLFGRISQYPKKKETLLTPTEFQAAFSKFTDAVNVLGKDWIVRDFKSAQIKYFKPINQLQKMKRIILFKDDDQVMARAEPFYRSNVGQSVRLT